MCKALGGGLVCGPWDSGGMGVRSLFLLPSVSAFWLGLVIWLLGVHDGEPFGVVLDVGWVAGLGSWRAGRKYNIH